jgi:hypothetical protein
MLTLLKKGMLASLFVAFAIMTLVPAALAQEVPEQPPPEQPPRQQPAPEQPEAIDPDELTDEQIEATAHAFLAVGETDALMLNVCYSAKAGHLQTLVQLARAKA